MWILIIAGIMIISALVFIYAIVTSEEEPE